jgi:hypothetical protein
MFQYLDKLRKMPERTQRRAVFLMSVGITLVILVIWSVFTSFRIGETDFTLAENPSTRDMPDLRETLSSFFNRVDEIVASSTESEKAAIVVSPVSQ